MKFGKNLKNALTEKFIQDKRYGELTPGKALKIYRELNNLSQNKLAELTGLKQATISSLENDRISLGIDRAKTLALVLKVHPGLLAFADWEFSDSVA
ncbi:MAG: helix-turn-helix transcriptional regulator [Bacteriovoracaceae bacterium]|nr:helix-turn-helix transcriptional regulator [Bacteriovoracaceae bacterium]